MSSTVPLQKNTHATAASAPGDLPDPLPQSWVCCVHLLAHQVRHSVIHQLKSIARWPASFGGCILRQQLHRRRNTLSLLTTKSVSNLTASKVARLCNRYECSGIESVFPPASTCTPLTLALCRVRVAAKQGAYPANLQSTTAARCQVGMSQAICCPGAACNASLTEDGQQFEPIPGMAPLTQQGGGHTPAALLLSIPTL